MLKLLTVLSFLLRDESREPLDREAERDLRSDLVDEEMDEEDPAEWAVGRRVGLLGLEGVTTMPRGTAGRSLPSPLGKGGRGRSDESEASVDVGFRVSDD